MKRIIILALLATICYTSFAQTREEFEAAIIDMNSQMPISMGPSGEAQSVAIEGQYVVYDIVVNDLGNTMSKGVLTPEKYKDTFLTFLPVSIMSTQYLSDFFSAMIEFNMGIIFHVTSENTGDVISVTISSQELNESINSQPNFKKVLDIAVMNTKASYPINTYGITLVDSELKNGYWVNTAIVNEAEVNFEAIQENAEQVKEQIKNMIVSATDQVFNMNLFYCCMADYGFSYDYVGSSSNKHVLIIFTADELMEILSSIQE